MSKAINNFLWILPMIAILMTTSVLATLNVSITSPVNNTITTDRTPDFVFTGTSNVSAMICDLNFNSAVIYNDYSTTSGTSNTLTLPTQDDGNYLYYVNCSSTTSGGSGKLTGNITIAFQQYTSSDIANVLIDNLIGILAAIFGFATLIGIILTYHWIKK